MRFLLDENLSPVVARELRRHRPGVDIIWVAAWHDGVFLGQPDSVLIRAAHQDQRILITFDVNTIPEVLNELHASGEEHAGIVFIDNRTVKPGDFGGLVSALIGLWDTHQAENWTNRCAFLRHVPGPHNIC